jgi:hypothetical protein
MPFVDFRVFRGFKFCFRVDSACDGRLQTEKFAGQRLEPRATSDARQTDFLIIYPSLYNAPLLVCSASACESQIAGD